MKVTCKGVVLHRFNYSDSSLIIKVLTSEFGLKTFLIKGARKGGKNTSTSIFQPFSVINFTAFLASQNKMGNLLEASGEIDGINIQNNIIKASIALFLSEMITKSIKEDENHTFLYEFVFTQIVKLNNLQDPQEISMFHVSFLINFLKVLGFFPYLPEDSNNQHQELKDFSNEEVFLQEFFLTKDEMLFFKSILNHEIPKGQQKKALAMMVKYYQNNVLHQEEIKSLKVLEAVFD
jgi:DNA repair protein RecO (recombination protein O)